MTNPVATQSKELGQLLAMHEAESDGDVTAYELRQREHQAAVLEPVVLALLESYQGADFDILDVVYLHMLDKAPDIGAARDRVDVSWQIAVEERDL